MQVVLERALHVEPVADALDAQRQQQLVAEVQQLLTVDVLLEEGRLVFVEE